MRTLTNDILVIARRKKWEKELEMNKTNTYITLFIILFVFSAVAYANGIVETKSGLKYEDLTIGDGIRAVPKKIATIHLIIWEDINGNKGKQLYDSYKDGSKPISFKIGTKKLADGLNIGVTGMCVGGKRRLYTMPFP